jgi:hypothetical protein
MIEGLEPGEVELGEVVESGGKDVEAAEQVSEIMTTSETRSTLLLEPAELACVSGRPEI